MKPLIDNHGVVHVRSPYSVAESMDRFETVIKAKGLTVFIRIDQQLEANKVDLILRPTQIILFGNPRAGTALMNALPAIAIDLPLKLLAWEDAQGDVWLSYNDSDYLQHRHGLSNEQAKLIAGVGRLISETLA